MILRSLGGWRVYKRHLGAFIKGSAVLQEHASWVRGFLVELHVASLALDRLGMVHRHGMKHDGIGRFSMISIQSWEVMIWEPWDIDGWWNLLTNDWLFVVRSLNRGSRVIQIFLALPSHTLLTKIRSIVTTKPQVGRRHLNKFDALVIPTQNLRLHVYLGHRSVFGCNGLFPCVDRFSLFSTLL